MPTVTLVLRIALAAVLIVAGALKIGHAADLASAIAGFRLLPGDVVAPLALALPYVEIFFGGYLLLGLFEPVPVSRTLA